MSRIAFCVLVVAAACAPATKTAAPSAPAPHPVVAKQPVQPKPAPAVASVPWSRSGTDWNTPPGPGPAPVFHIPEAKSFRLSNRLRVVVVPNRRLPIVSIQLVSDTAGSRYERKAYAGLAAFTADMLDEGAGNRDALGLSKQLERLGAQLWISAGEDNVTIGVTSLSSTLDQTLALLTDVVSKPKLTGKDFKRIKGDRLSAIRRRRDSPRRVAGLLYSRVLWGNAAYGRPISGFAATVKRIRLGNVRQFYRRHYAPAHMTLVVAGDVEPADLSRRLNRTLGRWRKRVATPRAAKRSAPVKTPPHLVVCNKPDAAQSVVRIGRISIRRKDPRYFAATVVNAALGGSFAARLMQRLREQLGYTYGARSSFWFGHHTGMWTVRTAIKTANTVDGIREALKLIDGVRASDLPAVELQRTKHRLIRGLPQSFDTNGSLVSVFAGLLEHNLPLSWYDGYANHIRAVTAAQARAFATAEWARGDLVITVVGDLKKVLPGLLSLGLGPALELDPEGKVLRTHPATDLHK